MYDYFMNFEEKFYQLFILGTQGNGLKPLLKKGLGGIIFFSHDIVSINDFKNLINDLKSHAKIFPFLSIDQEGGKVERTENIHNGKKYLSAKFAFKKGLNFLKSQTNTISEELKTYGINLNFAPCIDVNTNPDNPIIGERAFSDSPDEVIVGAKLVTQVLHQHNIIPCIKHYPGHGNANVDSHLELPEINLSLKEMENIHIKPFKALIDENIEMVMVAHIHCTCFDNEKIPASLSKNAINYLRKKLNFKGVIISDDMCMNALNKFGEVEALEKAVLAGVNLFIYRNSNKKTVSIINSFYQKVLSSSQLQNKIEASFEKIQELKNQFKF